MIKLKGPTHRGFALQGRGANDQGVAAAILTVLLCVAAPRVPVAEESLLPAGAPAPYLEREIAVRASDDAPLVVRAVLDVAGAPPTNELAAVLALEWPGGQRVAVGPIGLSSSTCAAVEWAWSGSTGRRVTPYALTSRANRFQIAVLSNAVDVSASRDGFDFRHLLTLTGHFPAGPARLRAGRTQPPATNLPFRVRVAHAVLRSDALALPDVDALGYQRREDWHASERSMAMTVALTPLEVFGPVSDPRSDAEARGDVSPDGRPRGEPGASLTAAVGPAGRAVWETNLGLALKSREGQGLIAATACAVLSTPAALAIAWDASPRAALAVNGAWLEGPRDTPSDQVSPGRRRLIVPAVAGTNRLTVTAWNTSRRHGDAKRLSLQVWRYDPLAEIALSERLERDFGDDRPACRGARFRRAALWAGEGRLAAALGALAANGADAESLVGQAALLRRLGRDSAAVETLRRAASLANEGSVREWLAAASGWQTEFAASPVRVALAESPAAGRAKLDLEQGCAAAVAGDDSEAGQRFARAALSPFAPDAAAEAAIAIGELQRLYGVGHATPATLAAVNADGVDSPDVRDRLLDARATAHASEGDLAAPALSLAAQTALETADRAARDGDFPRAVTLLEQALAERFDDLAPDGANGLASAGALARRRLLALPEPGARECRARLTGQADLRLAALPADAAPLIRYRLARRFPRTDAAATALDLAASHALDRGQADLAVAILRERVLSHAATPLALAKWAFAAECADDAAEARRVLAWLVERFATNALGVAGQSLRAVDYARGELARLDARPAPKAPAVAVGGWFAPFAGWPADDAAAFLGWPHPFALCPYLPVVADGAVFVRTSERLFAFDAVSGAARWVTRSPWRPFAAGAANHGAVPCLRPAVKDGRAIARLAGRGVDGRRTALEAHDSRDGRLLWSTENDAALAETIAAFLSEPTCFGGLALAVVRFAGEGTVVGLAALGADTGDFVWRRPLTGDLQRLADEDGNNGPLPDHYAPPVIADGLCLVALDAGTVAAVHAADGALEWMRRYPRAQFGSGSGERQRRAQALRAPPLARVAGARMFVAPRDTSAILCLRRGDGAPLWARDFTDLREIAGVAGDPAGASSTLLAVGTGLEALDAATGDRRWRWNPPPAAGRLMAVTAMGGEVTALCERGVWRVDARTGAEAGQTTWTEYGWGETGPANAVAVDGGWIGLAPGGLVRLAKGGGPVARSSEPAPAPATGWKAEPNAGAAGAAAWRWTGGPGAILARDGDEALVRVGDDLALVNVPRGAVCWRRPVASGWCAAMLEERRAILAYPSHVLAWNRGDGRAAWSWQPAVTHDPWDARWQAVAAAGCGGTVAFCTTNATVLLDARDGRLKAQRPMDCETVAARAVPGRLLVLGRGGAPRQTWMAQVLDATDGRTLAREPLEGNPRRPVAALADPDRGWLAAYVEQRFTLFRPDTAGAWRTLRLDVPGFEHIYRHELRDGWLAVTHEARRVGRDWLRSTSLWDCTTTNRSPVLAAMGDWTAVGGLAFGWVRETNSAAAFLTCREPGDGRERWRRATRAPNETVRGLFAGPARVWSIVSRPCWSPPFHNHPETVWNDRLDTWPPEKGRPWVPPDLDVVADGREETFVESLDPATGRLIERTRLSRGLADRTPATFAVWSNSLVRAWSGGLVCHRLAAGGAANGAPRAVSVAPYAARPPVLDGRLDDWTGPLPLLFGGPSGVVARVAWDYLWLYVAVEVAGESSAPTPPGAGVGAGDGVLLALDPEAWADDAFGQDVKGTTDNDLLLYATRTATGPTLVQFRGAAANDPRDRVEDRARVAIRRGPGGLIYEVALPWSALRRQGKTWLDEGDGIAVGVDAVAGGATAVPEAPRGLTVVRLADGRPEAAARVKTVAERYPAHPAAPRLRALARSRGAQTAPPDDAALVQDVWLAADAPPEALALTLRTRWTNARYGFYWADEAMESGFVPPGFVRMGPCPAAGLWQTLKCPLAAVGLAAGDVVSAGWAVKDGAAWWGPAKVAVAGRERPLVAPSDALCGSGGGAWVRDAPDGRAVCHRAGDRTGWTFYHAVASNVTARTGGPFAPPAPAGGWPAACRDGARELAGDPALVAFLRESERLPLEAGALADLYREAIRANADADFAHQLLLRLLTIESDGEVARQRYALWLDRGLGRAGSYRRMKLGLVRTGREWLPMVTGSGLNLSNHSGLVADVRAPLGWVPIHTDVRPDPWLPGDPNARHSLSLYVRDDGVAQGTFERVFQGEWAAGDVLGLCRIEYLTAEPDAMSPKARAAVASVRSLMREAKVSARQQRLFNRELARNDLMRCVPILP